MFEIVEPGTTISLSVLAFHATLSFKLISDKISLKDASFLHENSLSVAPVVEELSVVPATIGINSLSFSVGHIVLPLTLILIPASVIVLSIAVSHVIPEVPLEVASVLFYVPSSAFTPSINKLAFKVVSVVILNSSKPSRNSIFILAYIGSFDRLQVYSFAVLESRLLKLG